MKKVAIVTGANRGTGREIARQLMKEVGFVALLLLGACSFTRLAYNNAPPILAWMVDDYFDLSSEQRGWVRERFERAMNWHRSNELPEYRRFIEGVIARSSDGITVEDSRWAYDNVRAYYRRAVERLLPDAADLLARLDHDQVAALEKKFAEDNAKIEKEHDKASRAKRDERRAKRFIEQFEDWTGKLSPSQRDFVATQVAGIEDLTRFRLDDRRRRQAELLSLLRTRASREATLPGLKRLFVDMETWRNPAYTQKLKHRDEQVYAMVSALDATLSPEQRASVQKRMRGYLTDVTALLAKAAP